MLRVSPPLLLASSQRFLLMRSTKLYMRFICVLKKPAKKPLKWPLLKVKLS
ncbi:Uncharacterised protein [Vibrio cholerae]|nr:Uncharacterised protein [Vibrio cholerae]